MSRKPDRRYCRRAARWAVRVTYRSAIAICAIIIYIVIILIMNRLVMGVIA